MDEFNAKLLETVVEERLKRAMLIIEGATRKADHEREKAANEDAGVKNLLAALGGIMEQLRAKGLLVREKNDHSLEVYYKDTITSRALVALKEEKQNLVDELKNRILNEDYPEQLAYPVKKFTEMLKQALKEKDIYSE